MLVPGKEIRKNEAVIFVLLLVATFAVYRQVIDNAFLTLWDDNVYVTANEDIQGISFSHLKAIFSKFYVGNYAPVQMLSYMLDFQIWGLNARGFLITNVILHGLNGILLYLILRLLTFQPLPSALGSLFFLLHPVQVESVAWISQRKNLLCMLFFLQSLLFYLMCARKYHRTRLYFILSHVAFLLSLLAKSTAVILPLVLIAYDVFLGMPKKRTSVILDKSIYLTLALFAAGLTLVSQRPEFGGGLKGELHGGTATATFLTMITVFKTYLVNLAWPTHLSVIYNPEIKTYWDLEVTLSLILLLGAFLLPFFISRSQRAAAFWVSLSALGFMPVSQIFPLTTLMNDRYLYFPLVGISGLVALAIQSRGEYPRKILCVLIVGILSCLGVLTYQRTHVWSDSIALWQDAVAKDRESATGWYGLGLAYHNVHNYPEAISAYRMAIRYEPNNPDILYNLALLYDLEGEFEKAAPILEYATRLNPRAQDVLELAGHTQLFLGNLTEARKLYRLLLLEKPASPDFLNNLSHLEYVSGNHALSKQLFDEAVRQGGKPAYLYLDWARIQSIAHHRASALRFLKLALDDGIKNPESLQADDDLAFLRDTEEFRMLLRKSSLRTND